MSHQAIRIVWILLLILGGIWLFMGWLLPIFLPFLVGIALARMSEPATVFLRERLHLPGAAAVTIAVSGVFLLFVTVASFLMALLVRQVQNLAGMLPQWIENISASGQMLQQWLQQQAEKMPGGLGSFVANMTQELFSGSSAWMEQIAQRLPGLVTLLLGSLSNGVVGLVTAMISAYMIAHRLPWFRTWWQTHQPKQYQEKWRPWLLDLKKAMGGWLLAELKLSGLAFALMAVGFLFLHIGSGFLWAGLIAVVDAFPILGVGTVLVPWAVICFLQGNTVRAVGLLGIYGVVWLTRSILEPKWIGKGLGLDPLATLVASYAGWKLWGLGGMLLAPILSLAVWRIIKQIQR